MRRSRGMSWREGLGQVLETCKPTHGIIAMQKSREIEQLLQLLEQVRPASVMEIGTASGGTLFLWTRVAADDALILSLDLPQGPWGGGYRPWRSPFYRRLGRSRQHIRLLRGDSRSSEMAAAVRAHLGNRTLDFLFIDGDHSYEGVRSDFEKYATLVRPGGIVALHDICPDESRPDLGVDRFWRELRGRFECEELVESQDQRSYGIGVIRVPVNGVQAGGDEA